MEFKKITITNFLSYFEENEIDFSSMTTIFIGQNNTGKSKLFDAINFVLYNRVYDVDKEEWQTDEKDISKLILNKHKINEALKNNENSIEVSVSLLVDDFNSPNMYLNVTKTYYFSLKNQQYVFTRKDFVISEIDKLDGTTNSYLEIEASDRMQSYFPNSIKNFFLFQGEAASKIMNLQKGGNFNRAVKEIARLEIFEKAKDYAEKYENSIRNTITRKSNKNEKIKTEQTNLQTYIDNKKLERESYLIQKEEAEDNVSKYNEILDKNENELSKFKEFEQYFKDKEQLEENKKSIQNQLKSIQNEKFIIIENSVFYKVKDKIKSFKEFYSKLEKKGEVPPSIPQHEIKKALNCCRCSICNSDLSEGTEGRKFAESRLSKFDTDKLGKYLNDLNSVVSNFYEDVSSAPETLNSLLEQKRKADERKNALIKQKEDLENKLNEINISEEKTTETKNHIEEIKQTVSRYTTLLEQAKSKRDQADGQLTYIENDIYKKQKELDSLVVEDDEVEEEDKIKLKCATKLNSAMKRLYEVANKTAYEKVQEKANEYYKEMTKENAALVGDIKIDLENSEIYTVDNEGVRIRDINQGNRVSIQLALIAGILTVAQDQFDVQYPFVTDAPVSHLGGDNKRSTIETMINAFEQSIIIIKDDTSSKNKENDEIRKLIQESNDIEVAYELSLSKAENINDQFTVATKIKG